MYTLNDFSFETDKDLEWFTYRFGRTFGVIDEQLCRIDHVYRDGRQPYLSYASYDKDQGECVSTTTVRISDVKQSAIGVPRHGFVTAGRATVHLLTRNLYSKYKWGWQPSSDTQGGARWWRLLDPKHKVPPRTNSTCAITYDVACRDGEVRYAYGRQDKPVGRLESDGEGVYIAVDPSNDWLLYNQELTDLIRVQVV